MAGEEIIRMSAGLRGERKFQQAIDLILKHIQTIDDDIKVNAYLEAFYAAKEMGDMEQTGFFAQKVHRLEPNVPSIQPYLK